jgi:hypothetical protein
LWSGWLRPGLPYSSLSLQVKDNSIAPHKGSKGAKSFMDCDLVNFDQSFFHNDLILKMEDCCPRERISTQWAK